MLPSAGAFGRPSSATRRRSLKPPPSSGDVLKRFRKLGSLLGLDVDGLLQDAQEELARTYLSRIEAAARGSSSTPAPAIAPTRSGMVLTRPAPVSTRFETDELDSPRRKVKDALKGGSAECDGCGGVVTCHKTCTVRKYPVAGAA